MDSPTPQTTVLLADDHAQLREGVRRLLEATEGIRVVAEAADGRSAVQAVRDYHPDVVIMDVAMPELNGIEATRQILAEYPETQIIALSMHATRRIVLEMLRAGAVGYALKLAAFDELARALQAIRAHQSYLSPSVARVVLDEIANRDRTPNPFATLTSSEREVALLLMEGRPSAALASALGVSVGNVDAQRQEVMTKLGLQSVADLTRYAVRQVLANAHH